MAPRSPAPRAVDARWQYRQGGHAIFARDIEFYSGAWDARDRLHRIDMSRCPLFMLAGEDDYACAAERSAATAATIQGARFQVMQAIRHFPFAENPPLVADDLLPDLEELRRDRG